MGNVFGRMGSVHLSRRRWLQWMATAALAWPLWRCGRGMAGPTVSMTSPDAALGHRLRTAVFPAPVRTEKTAVLIVGGGIAGLSAARHLAQKGQSNFVLLELENHAGGNAAFGQNALTPYPLGAHYLPIPNVHDRLLLDFLSEIGVIKGFDADGWPVYDEFALCAAPQERLLIHGYWQEGLVPEYGVPQAEKQQIRRFLGEMHALTTLKGSDGRFAFDIPVALSSKDAAFAYLKSMTFGEWLRANAYDSQYLLWYLSYCCRDDYGAGIDTVSAWAGLHYHAARKSRGANTPTDMVLTWPEGNGFLMQKLAAHAQNRIKTRHLACKIDEKPTHVEVLVFDANTNSTVLWQAEKVILATPWPISERLLGRTPASKQYQYFPWIVANITLTDDLSGSGQTLCWDNVPYGSPGLGYIYAQHQQLGRPVGPKVITYYRPLDDGQASDNRHQAQSRTATDWKNLVLEDLENMHPGVSKHLQHIALHLWGHGMICPTPDFFRQPPPTTISPRIFPAHSDLSGFSLFEEAFHAGIRAGDWAHQHGHSKN
jgi:hypothetical protein